MDDFTSERAWGSPSPSGQAAGPQQGRVRLAVIDSDSSFVQVLTKRMSGMGWEFRTLASPVPPEELVAMRINCLVVDLALLGPNAWGFLERVCDEIPGLGVIVATPRSSVAQRVRGLRLGADDWIGKPCHPEEVIARVEAVVRRRRRAAGPSVNKPIVAGELEIRSDQFQAFVGGHSLDLTRREFELLHLLSENAGQVLPREEIYQRVWGYAMAHGDRSVDVFVRKLRQKLETASPAWQYIHTHFGIGYRFNPEGDDADGADLEHTAAPAPAEDEPAVAEAEHDLDEIRTRV